ncbi:ATP-dependent dethiobiotin synthetase BioD 1 [bacterium HR36]|nr:ATP-dependent dethiobiotin synthetase BioD 1 [bacterium HR36]
MRGWFVTGTDTGVGKTIVAATLARWCRSWGQRVGVCKPVATGAAEGQISEDTRALLEAAELTPDWAQWVTPFTFAEPAAPTVAARRAGKHLEWEAVIAAVQAWHAWADWLVVEGVGGLLCPLTEGRTAADLAKAIGLPLVIVARTALGTLNHTLLTVEAAQRRQLPIAGIVLNEATPPTGSYAEQTCEEELGRWLRVPILGRVAHSDNPTASAWRVLRQIAWDELAGVVPSDQSPRKLRHKQ